MALFIRDAEVDALAEEVRKVTNAKTKTEAVRRALEARFGECASCPAAPGAFGALQSACRRDGTK